MEVVPFFKKQKPFGFFDMIKPRRKEYLKILKLKKFVSVCLQNVESSYIQWWMYDNFIYGTVVIK